MVIEAGVQPHVTAALGRDRDARSRPSVPARATCRSGCRRPADGPRLVGTTRAPSHVFTDGAFVMGQTTEMTDPASLVVGRPATTWIVSLVPQDVLRRLGYQPSSRGDHSPVAQTFDFA